MIAMIRAVAKPFIVVAVVAAFLPTAASYAADNTVYVSPTGAGTNCTASQPCGDIATALSVGGATVNFGSVQVICLNGTSSTLSSFSTVANNLTVDVDCPGGFTYGLSLGSAALNANVRLRHIAFKHNSGLANNAIAFSGGGTVILEDCVFTDVNSVALDIEPVGPLNLVIRNSRISNNASAMLLKPGAGGSIKATFDRVVITGNSGGGIKVDSTNGPVNLDISDGEISNNGGNGLNAVGGAGGPAMFNIHNSVIAKNGVAGLQANGATAAALVDTTLFDTNAAGATSAVNGGRLLTYGNNRIVGSSGSGFTGPAPLQ